MAYVSIHAPTWGATHAHRPQQGDDRVSIHAPTWGATGGAPPLRGVLEVSIHAPTWGATRVSTSSPPPPPVSIHAPTWGATLVRLVSKLSHEFQSTHPRGVRLLTTALRSARLRFNPRTHVGCDSESLNRRMEAIVSIHAPTWGATLFSEVERSFFEFQSTHPRGVRPPIK